MHRPGTYGLFIMLSPLKLISLPFSGARGGRSLLHAPHCLLARPRPRHTPILPLRQRQGQLASFVLQLSVGLTIVYPKKVP